jgi:PhoH-like ATPase
MVKSKRNNQKLFVLDTNVLIHEPESIYKFDEHNIFIPLRVLEELDKHKRGKNEVARNARQAHRYLDELLSNIEIEQLSEGINLSQCSLYPSKPHDGKLFFQSFEKEREAIADNEIITVTKQLRDEYSKKKVTVILVTKDINMRIKASVQGLVSEDYRNDQVANVGDELLFSGQIEITDEMWAAPDVQVKVEREDSPELGTVIIYQITAPWVQNWSVNTHVYSDSSTNKNFRGQLRETKDKTVTIELLPDFQSQYHCWGIQAKNKEQNYALAILTDPEIDFVTIAGEAGTGKTLLTLAAALHQVYEDKFYEEIIVTRATVPMGEDIGFLPGEEEDKIGPWMGAITDALETLSANPNGNDFERKSSVEFLMSRVKIKSSGFMRGRSFSDKLFIIDEAQNLTSAQMHGLISRAGPGTKVVAIGNLKQIDTPYLSASTSGFSFAMDRMRNWKHYAHITLQIVERSRLADYVAANFSD